MGMSILLEISIELSVFSLFFYYHKEEVRKGRDAVSSIYVFSCSSSNQSFAVPSIRNEKTGADAYLCTPWLVPQSDFYDFGTLLGLVEAQLQRFLSRWKELIAIQTPKFLVLSRFSN